MHEKERKEKLFAKNVTSDLAQINQKQLVHQFVRLPDLIPKSELIFATTFFLYLTKAGKKLKITLNQD